jgi:hypothetical protein
MRTKLLCLLVLAAPAPALADDAPAPLTLFRLDVEDGFALHTWLYHEEPLGERWGILGDLHAQAPGLNPRFAPYLEIDVGPNLHLGGVQINPQLGVDLAWDADATGGGGHTRFADFIVELYVIGAFPRVGFESWNLYFIPFDGSDPLYIMRQLVNVRLVGGLAVGPHVEGIFIRHVGTDRLAVGGDVLYTFPWGQLVWFLASERERGNLETRVTFLRPF